jgi:hypothetical protein
MVLTMINDLVAFTASSKTSGKQSPGITVAYVVFAVIAFMVYHMFAEGEFSSILTLSAIFQCLAFSLLALQTVTNNGVQGISAKTLQLDAFALACRLSSTVWLDGYLPSDQTGDYLYQVFDALSLGMVLWLLHRLLSAQRRTCEVDDDSFSALPCALVCVVLAAIFHGDLDDLPVFDTLWMCGLFVSAVSVLPQLWMMSRSQTRVPALTCHFIAVMAFSRILSGTYMYHAHTEITCTPWIGKVQHAGYAILVAHVVHLVLLADFAYFYGKHIATSGLSLPLTVPETWSV